jgi:hypothetical protein
MKKVICLGLILIMFLVGCNYIAPIPEEYQSEDAVTYVDITDLIEHESSEVKIEEIVETEILKEPEVIKEEIKTTPVVESQGSVKEIPTVKVTEGETVNFPNLKATDPDGDKIEYTFSKPMDEAGEWKTKVGDSGEYSVTITASDGTSLITQEVRIIVEELNRPPVLEKIADMVVSEGDTIKLSPKALDPEGKPLTITYSGWMTSDTKKLDFSSAGEYIVRVSVSDGTKDVTQDIKVTVQDVNRPPQFVSII